MDLMKKLAATVLVAGLGLNIAMAVPLPAPTPDPNPPHIGIDVAMNCLQTYKTYMSGTAPDGTACKYQNGTWMDVGQCKLACIAFYPGIPSSPADAVTWFKVNTPIAVAAGINKSNQLGNLQQCCSIFNNGTNGNSCNI